MVRFWSIILLLAIAVVGWAAEQPQHRGTKLEGYAVEVTPDSTVTSGASEAVKVTFKSAHDATKVDAVKGVTTRD